MKKLTSLVFLLTLFSIRTSWAITFTPFGSMGQGGSLNGQSLTVGAGGSVFQLDTFLNIPGVDLNGSVTGTSAQLSFDPLPAGLGFSFNPSLSADGTKLTLTYTLTNLTSSSVNGLTFFLFLDADIHESTNTFFNEYGVVSGSPASGMSYEIDEPGYVYGDIFNNLLIGSLDNTNSVSSASPDDVGTGLGFALNLDPSSVAIFRFMISEDQSQIGPLRLDQFDNDSSDTVISLSGTANVVPEPSALALLATGLAGASFWRRRRQHRFKSKSALIVPLSTSIAVFICFALNTIVTSALAAPTVGANVNITNNSINQNEPMVAINPVDHNKLVVGYNDYRATGKPGVSWSWSDDGGSAWTYGGSFSLPGYNRAGDPVVAFDNAGTAYFTGLVYNYDASTTIESDGSIFLAASNDGGHTFNSFRTIVATGSGTANFLDKPWLYINPINNHIYLSWSKRDKSTTPETITIWFTHSTDGGATFSTPIQVGSDLEPRSFGSQISVGPANRVYVSWHTTERGTLGALNWDPPRIWIAESMDDGQTFGPSYLVATKQNSGPAKFISMGSDPKQYRIYITYADRPSYPGDLDIYVASGSTAGGPWAIKRVNDVTTREQFWPSLSVAPNGRVDVIWYDYRDDLSKFNIYYTSSRDYGATWEANTKVTSQLVTPTSLFAGDYITVASVDEKAVAVWTDNRVGNPEIFKASLFMPAPLKWNILQVDSNGGGGASLAVDSNGNQQIAHARGYLGSGGPFELKYTSKSGSTWNTETVDSGNVIGSLSLALDASDNPHIAYHDHTQNRLVYARKVAGSWAAETVWKAGANDTFCSLAVDSAGNPYISFQDFNVGRLRFAYKSGGAWTYESPDPNTLTAGAATSIVLDSSVAPHISYAFYDGNAYHLKYAFKSGSAWVLQVVDSSEDVGGISHLALDAAGTPHISYWDTVNSDLKYAHWNGSSWNSETVESAPSGGVAGRWSWIVTDAANNPHIAYYSDQTLRYARKISGVWLYDTADPAYFKNVGWNASLALDSRGNPQIAYQAAVDQALRYAFVSAAATSSATGVGPVTLSSSDGQLSTVAAISESSLPAAGKPSGVTFPFGFFSWKVEDLTPGATVTLNFNYPLDVPSPVQYWKVVNGTWTNLTSLVGDDDGDNVLTLTITDGGLGDADGLANGQISDPGGIAIAAVQSQTIFGLSARAKDGRVDLLWTCLGGDVKYNIYRGTTAGGPYQIIKSGEITNCTYADVGLTNGVTYYYRVTSLDGVGPESLFSNEASAKPVALRTR